MDKNKSNYWYKLDEFNRIITQNIINRLPSNCGYSWDDVSGQVNSTFIKLIQNYRGEAPNGLSLTSYVWQYAEKYTYRDLIRVYKRACNNLTLMDLEEPEEDENGNVRRQYGEYDIQPYTALDEHLEVKDQIDGLMKSATPEDRRMMQLMLDGYTLEEIGSTFGISKVAVLKRLRKYGSK